MQGIILLPYIVLKKTTKCSLENQMKFLSVMNVLLHFLVLSE